MCCSILTIPGIYVCSWIEKPLPVCKLNELAKEKGETEAAKSAHTFRSSASGYIVPDMNILVSALTSDQKLTEEEKEYLLEYIKKK